MPGLLMSRSPDAVVGAADAAEHLAEIDCVAVVAAHAVPMQMDCAVDVADLMEHVEHVPVVAAAADVEPAQHVAAVVLPVELTESFVEWLGCVAQ